MKSRNEFSIDWLFNPITKKEFFKKYFEQKHLHVKREDSDYFSELLNMDMIESFLYSRVLNFPSVRLTKSNEDIPPENYVLGGKVIPSEILKYVSEGATLILSGLHEQIPSLSLYCSDMLKEFGHKFQTNIYITPQKSQGFNIHYDTHDVFVLQIKGRKNWRLYADDPIKLPNKLQGFETDKYKPGPLSHEFVLNEGDVLYIPRGVMHVADTMDEMSVHITTGMLGYTWADLLIAGILSLSKEDYHLRKYIPSDLMTNTKNGVDHTKEFKEIFDLIKDKLSLEEMVENMQKELYKNQKNNIRGILETANELKAINSNTKFSVRRGIHLTISPSDENIVLEWVGKKVEFPNYTRPAIDYITNGSPEKFSQANLPDCLDEEGKVALLKRLTKEGYLYINN